MWTFPLGRCYGPRSISRTGNAVRYHVTLPEMNVEIRKQVSGMKSGGCWCELCRHLHLASKSQTQREKERQIRECCLVGQEVCSMTMQ